MIPVSISNSFSLLYSSAYNNLERAFKGDVYNQDRLDLQKIYAVTDELFDAIRASLYSRTVDPEGDIRRVYYNDIVRHLLKFRQLSKNHEQHTDSDLFLVAIRCFESLQRLAGQAKGLANSEGIELRAYTEIDFQNDYALAGTYRGEGNSKGADKPADQQAAKPKLTLKEIALKYVYEDQTLTRKNADQIASQYGHNSGEKLFQHFTYYSSQANRKGRPNPFTRKTLENKIMFFEKVIETLPENRKAKALDELKILKDIFESEF